MESNATYAAPGATPTGRVLVAARKDFAEAAGRQARAAIVASLVAGGMLQSDVGAALGISRSTVSDYVNDPSGDALRSRRHKSDSRPDCACCGAPRRNGGGSSKRDRDTGYCNACRLAWRIEPDCDGIYHMTPAGYSYRANLRRQAPGTCSCGAALSVWREPGETTCAPCQHTAGQAWAVA